MQSKWFRRLGLAALVAGVMGGSGVISGCASERDPIDRVQPGVVDKSFFLGEDLQDFKDDPEFRTRSFAIDSPANTLGEDTIGLGSGIDRIRWEVTENWLFARRSYQEAPGADAHGLPRVEVSPGKWEFPTKANGTIVAAYKIDKHFDIRRDYNSQTGEETNVIVENDNDRPWQDRQYMRIDWSQNQAMSTSGDISYLFGESSSATPIQYSATNENDEDRPQFDTQAGYFDITNKYQVKPEVNPSWGISDCLLLGWLNGSSTLDCTPAEVKMRHSYVRLTGLEDYEPFEESIATNDVIGTWAGVSNNYGRGQGTPSVTTYDPQYGYTDAKTKTYLPSHNIWASSHQTVSCSDNTDKDHDGTADVCANEITGYAGNRGSQCDTFVKKCTIPVRDRRVKTIAYWLNTDAPLWLQDQVSSDGKEVTEKGSIEDNTRTWNQLISNAVAVRREVECRRTGDGSKADCHLQFFTGSAPADKQMVVFGGWGIDTPTAQDVDKDDEGNPLPAVTMCHNPVRAYDNHLCGKVGQTVRLGDMRHNYAIFWDYDSNAHYGGVASIPADPVTGEMVGVTATTMMRSVTYAAAQQRDIIQIALGDVKIEDLIDGVQASRYAQSVKNGTPAGGDVSSTNGKTDAQIKATVANVHLPEIQSAFGEDAKRLAAATPMERALKSAKQKALRLPFTPTSAAADDKVAALSAQIAGTDYAQDLVNRNLNRVAAQSGNKSSAMYEAIKTFAASDPTKMRNLMDSFNAYLANKGICFQDPETEAGAGSIYQPSLAPYFKKLYGNLGVKERGDAIYNDLAKEAVKGIAFHEIGHSLGMRHNFASSWDAINFQPQYWQLRTNEGKSTEACTAARSGDTDSCIGPRYVDPETADELGLGTEARPGIEYFANTSTMEYQVERFGETSGAGTYDLHFMKTLYGRTLETFDAKQVSPDAQKAFGALTLSQGIPDDLVFQTAGFGAHYTTAAIQAKVFDPQRDCRAATDEEKASAKWRVVHGKICAQSPKDHLAYQDMVSDGINVSFNGADTPIGANGVRWHGNDENGKPLVRWAYRYGEDYSAGGYIHAKPGDSGADVYEITRNTIKRFDLTYPWSYFRRQQKTFAWWSLSGGVARNYFTRLRGYHWDTTTTLSRATPEDLTNNDQALPAVMAAAEMFNFLQRAILTPEPGIYAAGDESSARTPKRPGALQIFDVSTAAGTLPVANVGLVDGRFVQIDFDSDRGGAWDYQAYPKHVGFDEEKVLALRELVDSRPTLSTVSRENALDGRDPYISFRTDTPEALDRLIGGILSEDWETIGPSAVGQDGAMQGFSLLDKDPAKLVRPSGANILFPNIGYANQIGTGIYAMLFSRFSTDLVLTQKLRVRLQGDSGAVIPDSRKQGFVDPVTGNHYLATKFGTEMIQGRAVDKGIASRMLQRANEILAEAYLVDPAAVGGTTNEFGELKLLVGANGAPVSKNDPAADLKLRRYVGLLDGMRQVGNIYGGGPFGGGGGGGGGDE
ncbi:MAG: hypothetical protein JWP97_1076 [Labilithrix sp.]|nr:hypothetical protein [Labilithrix sp.]